MYKCILIVFGVVFSANAWPVVTVTQGEVVSGTGLKCKTTLRIAENARPKAIGMFVWGTGIYTNANDDIVDPAYKKPLEDGRLAVLSYDKPGVRYGVSDSEPIEQRLENKDMFYAHTQADLVDCAEHALKWARSIIGGDSKVFLHGHSEGTMIFTKLLTRLNDSKSDLLSKIDTVFFTGFAADAWKDIFEYQVTTIPQDYPGGLTSLYETIEKCDNDFLIQRYENACTYYKAAFEDVSMASHYRDMWKNPPAVRIRVYHGLQDPYTSAKPVRILDEENTKRRMQNLSALDFTVRYYTGGHGYMGNVAIEEDLTVMFEARLSQ